ncbi:ATP synthase regulation protein NCA2-domain-containing protein [Phycomyces nitens]|nr:ATP synthase regulation protein NCA2-domain-containing protein [Phycomyces nitens]
MTTYVDEKVKQLDSSLLAAFQNLEAAQLLTNEPGRVSDMQTARDQGDKLRFLSNAIPSLDLNSSTTLTNFSQVEEALDSYISITNTTDPSLEWLFVAKCTVAVYAFVFSKVLNSTLPLSESIHYWNDIHGNSLQEIYYALQTAPARIGQLAVNTLQQVRTSQVGIKSVLSSQTHILSSLFPVHAKAWTKESVRSPIQFLSEMSRRPLILQLIRDEIGQKKKNLEYFRSQQAARLGLLIKMTPQFTGGEGSEVQSFENVISYQTSRSVELIGCVLEPFMKEIDPLGLGPSGDKDLKRSMGTLQALSPETKDPTYYAKRLSMFLKNWKECEQNLDSLYQTYGPLSFVARYWIPTLALFFTGDIAIKYVFKRKEDIKQWAKEVAITGHDFIVHWIWEPVLKVWDTIRLKDQSLTLLSKEGLRSDLESLERMVINFAKDNCHMSDVDIARLPSQIKEGDMSLILKAYEQEMKNPIKNAVAGNLIQTLLIQVQKTKVDVDLAMSALDKLLKSNELNFAFLAVAPSMLLTWASFSWINNVYKSRTGQRVKKIGQPLRDTLRRVERLLNLGSLSETRDDSKLDSDDGLLSCESQGTLLCEVHLLRSYAHGLPNRNSMRELFMQDLRDLEDPKLTRTQKIQTVARMYRYWGFL